jgi:hypothetical protein
MSDLPETNPREHWALRYAHGVGGKVQIGASQLPMARRLERKRLVTLTKLPQTGWDMELTELGTRTATQPSPAGGEASP